MFVRDNNVSQLPERKSLSKSNGGNTGEHKELKKFTRDRGQTEYIDTQNKEITQDKADTAKKDTDNPHDKGYKMIFSIKKNFLDFIKKYINLD